MIRRTHRNSPARAISADNTPGNCWAFEGDKGHMVVRLSKRIFVKYLTIEHIPKSLSPSGQIRSAPREISLAALSDSNDKVWFCVDKTSSLPYSETYFRLAIIWLKLNSISTVQAYKCFQFCTTWTLLRSLYWWSSPPTGVMRLIRASIAYESTASYRRLTTKFILLKVLIYLHCLAFQQ